MNAAPASEPLLALENVEAGYGSARVLHDVSLALYASEVATLLGRDSADAVFALAGRVSVLVYGRLVAAGAPGAIRTGPEVRAAYLGEEAA